MKRLLPTLTAFGILIITFQTYLVLASENFQARFGNVTLSIPYPKNLCLLKNTMKERVLYDMHKLIQKKNGMKLLAIWIDCESHKKLELISGNFTMPYKESVMVVGHLTGNKERTFPQYTAKQYIKSLLKQYNEFSFEDMVKSAQKNLDQIISENGLDDTSVDIEDPINLGILGVTDSLHIGLISRYKTQGGGLNSDSVYGILTSITLVKGIPVNITHHKPYEDANTIKIMLSDAKYYSVRFLHEN